MSGEELGKIQPIIYVTVCNILKRFLCAKFFQAKKKKNSTNLKFGSEVILQYVFCLLSLHHCEEGSQPEDPSLCGVEVRPRMFPR